MVNFASADIFINEFLANGIIEPDNEWVELFNNGSSAIDLTEFSISETGSENLSLGVTIPAKGFVVLVENFTLFNSTFSNLNSTGVVVDYGEIVPSFQLSNSNGIIELYNNSGDKINSIEYAQASTQENVSVGRIPDGGSSIFNLTVLTPGGKNDNAVPVFNKWLNPAANNSFIKGWVNVTINITDAVYAVNVSLINFNNSNFTMSNAGDLWYFVWNTSLNTDKLYNLTIFFNDSLGLSNTDTLFSITVDNTKPDFNKWVNPNKNNTNVSKTVNIIVNITDSGSTVNTSFVQINNINFSMDKSGDIWNYTWNTYSNSDGKYNLTVYFNDTNGFSNSDILFDITIDNTNPQTEFAVPIAMQNISDSFLVNITASDATSGIKELKIQNGTNGNWVIVPLQTGSISSGSYRVTLNSQEMPNGLTTFTINTTDFAGNSNTSVTQTVMIDNVNPSVIINKPVSNENISGITTLNATVTDAHSSIKAVYFNVTNESGFVIINVDNEGNYFFNTTFNTSVLTDGNHTAAVYAFDHAGNINNSVFASFTSDNTNPNVSIIKPLNNFNASGDLNITVNIVDGTTGVKTVAVQNGTNGNWIPMSLLNGSLNNGNWNLILDTTATADGSYTITINATDFLGNYNDSETSTIIIDNTKPQTGFVVPIAMQNISDSFLVNVTASDATSGIKELKIQNGTNGNWVTVPLQTGSISSGSYRVTLNSQEMPNGLTTFTINTTDFAGNSNTSVTQTVVIDNVNPSVTINNPIQGANLTGVKIFNATVTDAHSRVKIVYFNVTNESGFIIINVDNESNYFFNTTFNTSVLTDGNHTVTVYAFDHAGNINNSVFVSFTSDNTGPSITNIVKFPTISYNNDSVTLNATISDNLFSVDSILLSSNYTKSLKNYSTDIMQLNNIYSYFIGAKNFSNQQVVGFQWYANDTLGNPTTTPLQTFKVENRAPIFNESDPVQNATISEGSILTLNLNKTFYDLDFDELNYTEQSHENVTVSINDNTGDVVITPKTQWFGTAYVVFYAFDFVGASNQSNNITVTISPLGNHNPAFSIIPNINFSEDSYYDKLDLSIYCSDIDPGQICTNYTLQSISNNNVNVTVNPTTGKVNISAVQNWNGTAFATFLVRDNYSSIPGSDISNVVTINVTPVNDLPFINFSAGNISQTKTEDFGSWIFNLTPFEADVDIGDEGHNLIWNISNIDNTLVNVTISQITDVLTFTTIPNAHGSFLLKLNLTDPYNASVVGFMNVTIISINDIPYINATLGPYTIFDNVATVIDLSSKANDDNDSNTLNLIWDATTQSTLWGFVGSGGAQSVVLAPKSIQSLTSQTDTLTFTAKDAENGQDSRQVSVTIQPFNDQPTKVTDTNRLPANNSVLTSATNQFNLDWENSTDQENQPVIYHIFFENETNPKFNATVTQSNYTITNLKNNTVYYWYIVANDGVNNASNSSLYQFKTNFDNAPTITAFQPSSPITILENQTQRFNATLLDIDGNLIKFNWTIDNKENYSGITATFNETISFNYTTSFNDAGTHTIRLSIRDTNENNGAPQTWTVNVNNNNRAPLLDSIADKTIAEDSTLKFNITAIELDNNTITFTSNITNAILTKNANNSAAEFTWTPTNDYVGSNVVNITVSDGSLQDSKVFMITVSNTNDAPVLMPIGSLSATQDTLFNYTVQATDQDMLFGDTINFTSNSTIFKINSTTALINFTPTNSHVGVHKINITVNDALGSKASEVITFIVNNKNDAPTLDAISDKNTIEDSTLKINVNANEPDNDVLVFSSNITSILFSNAANNSAAELLWIPTNDYVGSNVVNITVSDGSLTDSKIFIINVSNTNDAPTITEFFPLDNRTIAKNVGIQKFNLTFTDVDIGDDAAAYWFRNTNLIAPNSSNVTITSLPEGIYNITIIVNDTAGAKARYEWRLNVTDVILGDGLTSPILSLNETQRRNVTNVTINQSTFGGIDFGNSTLDFIGVVRLEDAFNISRGLISVDSKSFPGLNKSASIVLNGLNFTKAPLIYLADGFESTAGSIICPDDVCTNRTYDSTNKVLGFSVPHFSTYFTQTNTTNGAPIITSAPVITATENAKYTYDVEATDPDGNALIFSLITKPSGMSISSSTGVISWTPTTAQSGLNNVMVSVSDGSLTAEQSFNIIVGKGPRLIISDLDVKIDAKTDKSIQNNTKISREAAPGSKVEFNLEVENLFTDDEDLEIEDIDVEITIENIDDGDDLDEDVDEFDLKAGKNEDLTIKFDIPLEVDEDIYDVIISIEGQDENQTTHEILWNLELQVEKEKHEIRILKAGITPLIISCQRQVALNAEIINTGTEDEDDATLEITSPELGISSVTKGLELDEGTEDNRFTKQVTELIGKDVPAGVYPVTFNTYYDSSLSETKTVDLTVEECELTKAVKEEVKEKKPKVGVIRPKVAIEPKAEPAEPSFRQTSEYKTLLAILVVVFIGTAVFIVGGTHILLKK